MHEFMCVQQVELPQVDDPYISKEMYSVALGLIQSFDEMEGKESRWANSITAHLISLIRSCNNYCASLLKQQSQKRRWFDFF